jgi:hypothetical protein
MVNFELAIEPRLWFEMVNQIAQLDLQNLTIDHCLHRQVREIGQDFDEDGRLLRLVRCQRCGLLMREYLPVF